MKTEIMSLADRLRLEGREEGRVEGRLEGRKKGRREGKKEGQEEKVIIAARNMFQRGFSITDIADILEVNPKFVEELKIAFDKSISGKRKNE